MMKIDSCFRVTYENVGLDGLMGYIHVLIWESSCEARPSPFGLAFFVANEVPSGAIINSNKVEGIIAEVCAGRVQQKVLDGHIKK